MREPPTLGRFSTQICGGESHPTEVTCRRQFLCTPGNLSGRSFSRFKKRIHLSPGKKKRSRALGQASSPLRS